MVSDRNLQTGAVLSRMDRLFRTTVSDVKETNVDLYGLGTLRWFFVD